MIALALVLSFAVQEPVVVDADSREKRTEARAVAPLVQETGGSSTATPASETPRFTLDYAGVWTEAQYEAELARLAQRHAALVKLGSVGSSRSGRRIALLTAGDLSVGDPDTRPAVVLVQGLAPKEDGRPEGPAAALHALRGVLERAEGEAALRELFARTTLYVLPAPDPDALFATSASTPRACRLDRNFPSGWKPWSSTTCAQGPYPLSEPETRDLARFLGSRSNAAAVVILSSGAPSPAPGDAAILGPDAAEATLCARMAAAFASDDPPALERASRAAMTEAGSLAAFARARLGAFTLPLDPLRGATQETELGRAPASMSTLAPGLASLLRELPHLDVQVERTERLREKLWLVEVALRDAALLPTASAEERRRSPASVWLTATGARVAQAGLRRVDQPDQNLDPVVSGPWPLGHLGGGETVRVFLVVEAEAGAVLDLAFQSLRGATAHVAVSLST